MTDVKITFHIQLAKQSQAVKKFVTDIKQDLDSLNRTMGTMGRSATRSIDATTTSLRKKKKVVQEVTEAVKKQQAEVDRLGKRYAQQASNMRKSVHAMPGQLAGAATNPQILSPSAVQSAGLFGGFNVPREARAQAQASRQLQARLQSQAQRNHNSFQGMIPTNPAILAGVAGSRSNKAAPPNLAQNAFNNIKPGFLDGVNLQMKQMQANSKAATQGIKSIALATGGMNFQLQKTPFLLQKVQNWFTTIRGAVNYAIFLAITAALAGLIANFIQFDARLREAAGLSKNVAENLGYVTQKIEDMTTRVPKASADLAAGFRDIVSSTKEGVDGQLKLLQVSSMLAVGGFVPTATATKALVTALNSYGYTSREAMAVSDVLFQTMNLGIVTVEELANELGKVTPIASAAGISIKEVGAAMATLTANGNDAARSATTLARMMNDIIKPASEGERNLRKMLAGTNIQINAQTLAAKGLEGTFRDVNIAVANYVAKAKGISQPITDLEQALAMVDANKALAVEGLSKIFTDKENLKGFTEILGSGAVGENGQFTQNFKEIENAAGATKNAFDQAAQSYQNMGLMFRNQVAGAFDRFAKSVAPYVMSALFVIGTVLKLIINIFTVVVKAGYPVLILIGFIIFHLGLLSIAFVKWAATAAWAWLKAMGPVGWVIGGIVLILSAISWLSDGAISMADVLAGAWNVVIWAIKSVIIVFYALGYGVAAVIAGIWAGFEWMGQVIGETGEFIANRWDRAMADLHNFVARIINGIGGAFSDLLNWLTGKLQEFIDKFNKFLPDEWKVHIATDFNWGNIMKEKTGAEKTAFGLAKSFSQLWTEKMAILGAKSVPQVWDELSKLLPYQTGESLTNFVKSAFSGSLQAMGFDFEGTDLSVLDSAVAQLPSNIQQTVENVEFAKDIISEISAASESLIQAMRDSSEALIKWGVSANQMSEMFMLMRQLELQKTVVDMVANMQKMADGLAASGRVVGAFTADAIRKILEKTQVAYLDTADQFLAKLLSFGSPEELAGIFAQQHYISQNVNQNVVISPYIQIDGAQDTEQIMETIDRALTEWAARNGLTPGR